LRRADRRRRSRLGLTLALELARRGARFRIIDKTSAPTRQSRALAIFPRTLEVFESIGLLEDVLAAGQKIRRVFFEGAPYTETFALADVKIENAAFAQDEIHLFFQRRGMFAVSPLPSERFRLIADVSLEAETDADAPPTLAEMQTLFNGRCP
jgi:2-polyprenyl-6-methoxyphenol hydroxylase-like FAD-dependent oxidoreductase